MDYRGIIESKLEQNNGILSSRDIKALNIPSIYLTRMVNEGILNRVSRGIYLSTKGDYDEYYISFKNNMEFPFFHMHQPCIYINLLMIFIRY